MINHPFSITRRIKTSGGAFAGRGYTIRRISKPTVVWTVSDAEHGTQVDYLVRATAMQRHEALVASYVANE